MSNVFKIFITSTMNPIRNLMNIIKFHGGIRKSLYSLYRMEELKMGKLMGQDRYGNKYYENPRYFYLRDRWVVYADYHVLDYDASMVPPEWHGWLHHSTDIPPCGKDPLPYCYSLEHNENKTGTSDQYYPYSTTRPKILPWNPPDVQKCRKQK